MYHRLDQDGYIHNKIRAQTRAKYKLDPYPVNGEYEKSALEESPLLKNYMSVGCKVCSAPAYIDELEMLHVMVLLNVETIPPKVKKMFFS